MATVRATSPFDMRSVVPATGALTIVNDSITLVGGTRGTMVTGDFAATASGVTGTGRAGELSASGTWLRGDVNGDRLADFAILLDHDPILTATDVIL